MNIEDFKQEKAKEFSELHKLSPSNPFSNKWENISKLGFKEGFESAMSLDLAVKFAEWIKIDHVLLHDGQWKNCKSDGTCSIIKTSEDLYVEFIETLEL